MLTAVTWIFAATVAAGLGLSCLWLLERRPQGWARLGSAAHGLAGATGTALLVATLLGGARDPQGFGKAASWMLAIALLGGSVIVAAQLRRRRPPGIVVATHAMLGLGGFVILLAYISITH